MNLETGIIPKNIRGLEVDGEGLVHPIVIVENRVDRLSILHELYEDIMRWLCNILNVDYFHCSDVTSLEDEHVHQEFMKGGLTALELKSNRF